MRSILLITIVSLSSGCVLAVPPCTKITLQTIDRETGNAVSNAVVHTGYTLKRDPWGNGTGKNIRVKEPVNKDGLLTLEGQTISDERGGTVFADGYYSQMYDLKYSLNVVLNRWEPWNPTIVVKLRPQKKPVPMVYKFQKWVLVPEFGKQVGYDLKVGDWVAPHGKGIISDFVFIMNLDRKSMSDADASYKLTFSNPSDGIQDYLPPVDLRSSFIFPYTAPSNGYKPVLCQRDVNKPYSSPKTTERKNINYIFRVRTEVDESGNIISACYGRIRGELELSRSGKIQFSYWFNPDPASRSLESNKKPY